MAVLLISEIAGQTREGYDALLPHVLEAMQSAPGFIMHSSHPTQNGWRVVELWESREDSGRFYAANIAPNLPEGLRPKVSFEPLHDVYLGSQAA